MSECNFEDSLKTDVVGSHPDWQAECLHFSSTLQSVRSELDESIKDKQRIDDEIQRLKETGDPDSSIDYSDLSVGVLLQGSLSLRLRRLHEALKKPYFARMDFQQSGWDIVEKYYIGKMILIRESDMRPIIIDWRAPVATLYYEGRLGKASYTAPKGVVEGELSLKRQYTIDNAVLKGMFDIDITTNDDFLQAYLGANADNRLKDIVSSIQAEQNRIIRADMWTPLIVQGAAGSGKTTIALHRIAYLVYTYEKTFTPEAFMIIAPNALFLNYISEILPELGVDRVRQTTFESFAMELLRRHYVMQDTNEKLTILAENRNPVLAGKITEASRFKASMRFKHLIDLFMDEAEKNMLPDRDFCLVDEVIISRDELVRLFTVEYRRWSVKNRLQEVRKHIVNAVAQKMEYLTRKIERLCLAQIARIKSPETTRTETEKRLMIIVAYEERDDKLQKLKRDSSKAISSYLSGILKPKAHDWYQLFLEWLLKRAENSVEVFAAEWSLKILGGRKVEVEDLAPLIHIHYRVFGINEKIRVRHIVIDEAQDFSAFQIDAVRSIVPDSSFTLLGDLSQGIHSYRSLSDWNEIQTQVFTDRRSVILTLEQSYRTTVEIMEAANRVSARMAIAGVPPAVPVIRHGDEVKICKHSPDTSVETMARLFSNRLKELKSKGMKLLAVIGKTGEECLSLYRLIVEEIPELILIRGTEDEYSGGIMVVPAHLSKGLEFDAVIISDACENKYNSGLTDSKLLYVAMTRAMHILDIHSIGEPSSLLSGIEVVEHAGRGI